MNVYAHTLALLSAVNILWSSQGYRGPSPEWNIYINPREAQGTSQKMGVERMSELEDGEGT